jgi:hypothetical protein
LDSRALGLRAARRGGRKDERDSAREAIASGRCAWASAAGGSEWRGVPSTSMGVAA